MGEVFIWHYYNQLVIRRFVWGEDPDAAVVRKATKEEIPRVLDYLEHEVPERGYRFGNLSIADVAVATFFRNAAFAGFTIDAAKWPKTAAFVATVLGHEAFQTLRPYEELLLRTPIAEHRAALQAAGAPVAGTTFGTTSPRRGVLAI